MKNLRSREEPNVSLVGKASLWLICALTVLIGARFSYLEQFSFFSDYDDEGCLLQGLRRIVGGASLYDSVSSRYGPLYYFLRWLQFGWAGLPLTHDVVRITAVMSWIVAAIGLALAAFFGAQRGWRRVLLAVGTLALAFIHLDVLKKEPGHPQEVVVLLLSFTYLFVAASRSTNSILPYLVLGVGTGALCMTKINIGVFFGVAATLSVLSFLPKRALWNAVRATAGASSVGLCVFVLRTQVSYGWAIALIASTAGGLALCLLSISLDDGSEVVSPSSLAVVGAGALGTAAILAGFVLQMGSSLGAMLTSIVLDASRFSTTFVLPPRIGNQALGVVGASLAIGCAVLYRMKNGGHRSQAVVMCAKAFAAVFTVWTIAETPVWLAVIGPTWAWLALIPAAEIPGGGRSSEMLFRRLLALAAVLQPLQAFPVAGSQLNVGTITFIPMAALFVSDIARTFGAGAAGSSHRELVTPCAGFATIGVLLLSLSTARSELRYRANEPVVFSGFERTRLPSPQAATYRWLVESVRQSDGYVSSVGLNSLSFWAETPQIGGNTIVGWTWMHIPEAAQRAMITETTGVRDLLVIDHPGLVERDPWEGTLFGRFIRREFVPTASVGPYTLMRRAEFQSKPQVGSAVIVPPPPAGVGPSVGPGGRIQLSVSLPERAPQDVSRAVTFDFMTGEVFGDSGSRVPEERAEMNLNSGASVAAFRLQLPSGSQITRSRNLIVQFWTEGGIPYSLAVPRLHPGRSGPRGDP